MNPIALIDKYYPEDNELKKILLKHSRSVALWRWHVSIRS